MHAVGAGAGGRIMRNVAVVVAAMLAALAVAGSARAAATIEGQWQCRDRGTVLPIRGARLELRTTGLFGGVVTTGFTDDNGRYSLTAPEAGRYDVRLVLRDRQGVHLSDSFIPWDWYADSGDFGAGNGTNLIGATQLSDGAGNTPVCAVWQGAHEAFSEYRNDVGTVPSYGPDLLVRGNFWPNGGVPFTTHTVINWPGGYLTGASPGDFSVSRHEFGHTIRFAADGDAGHFLGDVLAYTYLQNHNYCDVKNAGFAFNEGWAEYWSGDIGGCNRDNPEAHPDIEGDVAASLARLQARCNISRADMVATLVAGRGVIHSFDEFQRRLVRCAPQADPAPPPASATATPTRPVSVAASSARLAELLAAARRRIVLDGRHLRRASAVVAGLRPCTGTPCDRQLAARVLPPVLRARIAATRLQVRLLKPYSTPAGAAAFRKLRTDRQSRAMTAIVRSFRVGVAPIVRRGVLGAQAAVAPLLRRDHSRRARALAAGLRAARRAKLGTAGAFDVLQLGPLVRSRASKVALQDFHAPPPRQGIVLVQPDPPPPPPAPAPSKQATSVSLSCPGKSAYGSAFSVSGDLAPALSGSPIRITYTLGSSTATQSATTDGTGHFGDSYKPSTPGSYSIQAFYDGDATHAASASPTCTTVVS